MIESSGYCVITTTCRDSEEALNISTLLIGSHLAACVQISEITSCYEWKGVVNTEKESLLTIKAKSCYFEKIEAMILQNHSYEVPEVIQIPITNASASYLKWMDDVSG